MYQYATMSTNSIQATPVRQRARLSDRQYQISAPRICSPLLTQDTISQRILALPQELYDEILDCTLRATQHRIEQLSALDISETQGAWNAHHSLSDFKFLGLVHLLAQMVETSRSGDPPSESTMQQMVRIFNVHFESARRFLRSLNSAGCGLLEAAEVFRVFKLGDKYCCWDGTGSIGRARDRRFISFLNVQDKLCLVPLPTLLIETCKQEVIGLSKDDPWSVLSFLVSGKTLLIFLIQVCLDQRPHHQHASSRHRRGERDLPHLVSRPRECSLAIHYLRMQTRQAQSRRPWGNRELEHRLRDARGGVF